MIPSGTIIGSQFCLLGPDSFVSMKHIRRAGTFSIIIITPDPNNGIITGD